MEKALSDPERELLELGRSALEPTLEERAALRARIDAAVGASAAAPAPRAWGGYLAGAVTVAALTGAVLFSALSEPLSEPPREPVDPPEATVIEPPPPPAESPLEPAVTDVVERAPIIEATPRAPRERAARVHPEPTDSLAAELAIVSAARRALARGDGEGARAALARHAREFPEGALTEERSALEVLALCATGEHARAAAAARAFLARYPRSVSSASVRGSCAASTLDP